MGSKFYRGGSGKQKDKMQLRSYIEWLVPRVYAAFACELWDRGWTVEQIQEIFTDTQDRWCDSVNNDWDILKNVEEVTGIKVEYFYKTGKMD